MLRTQTKLALLSRNGTLIAHCAEVGLYNLNIRFYGKINFMKILIADDSSGWIEYHTKVLESMLPPEAEIDTAKSAKEGLDKITLNIDSPYDIILTDMQMEGAFLPLYAGEWFIRQIKTFPQYDRTKIVIISAAPNIKSIAGKYNVEYLPKPMCQLKSNYGKIFE